MVPLDNDRSPKTLLTLSLHKRSTYWQFQAHEEMILNFQHLSPGDSTVLTEGFNRLEIGPLVYWLVFGVKNDEQLEQYMADRDQAVANLRQYLVTDPHLCGIPYKTQMHTMTAVFETRIATETSMFYVGACKTTGDCRVMKEIFVQTPEHLAQIEHEIKILEQLKNCEGLIHVYEISRTAGMRRGDDPGLPITIRIVTKIGESLKRLLGPQHDPGTDLKFKIVRQLLRGADKMHENGIVHQNISLENIIYHVCDQTVSIIGFSKATQRARGSNPRISEIREPARGDHRISSPANRPRRPVSESKLSDRLQFPENDDFMLASVLGILFVPEAFDKQAGLGIRGARSEERWDPHNVHDLPHLYHRLKSNASPLAHLLAELMNPVVRRRRPLVEALEHPCFEVLDHADRPLSRTDDEAPDADTGPSQSQRIPHPDVKLNQDMANDGPRSKSASKTNAEQPYETQDETGANSDDLCRDSSPSTYELNFDHDSGVTDDEEPGVYTPESEKETAMSPAETPKSMRTLANTTKQPQLQAEDACDDQSELETEQPAKLELERHAASLTKHQAQPCAEEDGYEEWNPFDESGDQDLLNLLAQNSWQTPTKANRPAAKGSHLKTPGSPTKKSKKARSPSRATTTDGEGEDYEQWRMTPRRSVRLSETPKKKLGPADLYLPFTEAET